MGLLRLRLRPSRSVQAAQLTSVVFGAMASSRQLSTAWYRDTVSRCSAFHFLRLAFKSFKQVALQHQLLCVHVTSC